MMPSIILYVLKSVGFTMYEVMNNHATETLHSETRITSLSDCHHKTIAPRCISLDIQNVLKVLETGKSNLFQSLLPHICLMCP